MFICGMVLRCAAKLKLESGPVTADLITNVVHSFEMMINDIYSYKYM